MSKCAPSPSASASAAADERAANASRAEIGVAASPVEDDELAALFAPLAAFRTLVLAVSGGADSMALMLLVRRWTQTAASPAPRIVVAIVDHGLRAGSRAEAEWVVGQARAAGFEASLLTWSGDKPDTGIQDAARSARYALLAEAARVSGHGPAAIVTAHTEDDQAETVLMRLGRGSGVDGLAAMQPLRPADALLPPVMIARPLLGVAGARLRATLERAGQPWIEDPSNDAARFERVRIRKSRARLAELGLTNEKLALSARRLSRVRDVLETAVDDLQQRARLDLHAGAFASLDAGAFDAAAEELRLRLLARLVASFGGRQEPVRMARLEGLVTRLSQGGFDGATLAGAVVCRHGAQLRVYREAGRNPLPTLKLAPGTSAIWDNRFRVALADEAAAIVEVRALGAQAFAKLRQQLGVVGIPAAAAVTLPAFWRGEEVLFAAALADFVNARTLQPDPQGPYLAEFLG